MAMKKKYILVVNPISGDVDKTEILVKTMAFAEEFKVEIITYETSGNEDDKAIKNLYNLHKPERILIAGGDGTIKMVAEALEKQDVIFGKKFTKAATSSDTIENTSIFEIFGFIIVLRDW